jgi:hypothetical protein
MLGGDDGEPAVGREARLARTAQGRPIKNALALPKGCIIVIDELGRPLKQLAVTMSINGKPAHQTATDDYGKIYPLAGENDEVKVDVEEAHESGAGDSIATASGQHFELGGDGPHGL